jgi:hypothetical protein
VGAATVASPTAVSAQRVFQGYEDATEGDEPRTALHPLWAIVQLVPSFQLAYAEQEGVTWGLRWQTSPLLVSWGTHPALQPFRMFPAEPLVRYSGSAELFVTAEYFHLEGAAYERLMFRAGMRAHVPIHHRGENVAWSLGAAYARMGPDHGPSFETGIHILSGVVSLSVVVTPWHRRTRGALVLGLRYF